MSVRGIRIWRRNDARFQPSILVEKNGLDGSLLFQGGAIATLGKVFEEIIQKYFKN